MRQASLWMAVLVVLTCVPTTHAPAQTGGKIWRDFVWLLRHDEFGVHRIAPYDESLRGAVAGFLRVMQQKADWAEWDVAPEVYTVGQEIHCLVPLTFDSSKSTYCFTFSVINEKWYLRDLQTLGMRLDTVTTVPVAKFPDIPDAQKDWLREEDAWLTRAKFFGVLSRTIGKDSALQQFKDGSEYLLAATTRIPILPAWKAFILYLCWEQANVRGSEVTLEAMDDSEAVVQLTPIALLTYGRNGLLSTRMSYEDYTRLFEVLWEDRASAAGWRLHITYQAETCLMKFDRRAVGSLR